MLYNLLPKVNNSSFFLFSRADYLGETLPKDVILRRRKKEENELHRSRTSVLSKASV
jgi:hypothetical protein